MSARQEARAQKHSTGPALQSRPGERREVVIRSTCRQMRALNMAACQIGRSFAAVLSRSSNRLMHALNGNQGAGLSGGR
eukprot:6472510-Alexandrium_andersonii.AAC.1